MKKPFSPVDADERFSSFEDGTLNLAHLAPLPMSSGARNVSILDLRIYRRPVGASLGMERKASSRLANWLPRRNRLVTLDDRQFTNYDPIAHEGCTG